ncbi:MAG TPA: hypothetical protein VMW90_10280 [Acidobacteriota bacterium]|nr:hypothetical protein [Acidobacteriota bacterium]
MKRPTNAAKDITAPLCNVYVDLGDKKLVGVYQECACSFCLEGFPGGVKTDHGKDLKGKSTRRKGR